VLDEGADIIVAQGSEAGGHGSLRATLPLVPAVADPRDRAGGRDCPAFSGRGRGGPGAAFCLSAPASAFRPRPWPAMPTLAQTIAIARRIYAAALSRTSRLFSSTDCRRVVAESKLRKNTWHALTGCPLAAGPGSSSLIPLARALSDRPSASARAPAIACVSSVVCRFRAGNLANLATSCRRIAQGTPTPSPHT
jgi:hypothetical protein